MARGGDKAPQDGPDATERALARSLVERLEGTKGTIRVSLRELRDASPGHRRLTLNRRLALQRALGEAGLTTSPALGEADLDEPIEIRFAEPPWRTRVRLWIARPATRGTRIAITLVGLAAALLSLSQLLPADDDPEPMSGDVNVLVAELAGPDSDAGGRGLSESLFRSLHTVMPSLDRPEAPDVQIRGPRQAGVAHDGREAQELAAANGAQIVVYGETARRNGDLLVLPKLFVDPQWLIGAEELGGEYALAPIDLGRFQPGPSLAGRSAFRAAVADQVEGIAALTIGLGWFQSGHWAKAEPWFQAAGRTWERGEQRAVAELFVGNAAGKQGRYAEAEAAYRRAAAEPADPSRARLGLTQIELNRTMNGCGEETDVGALGGVVARFAQIAGGADPATLPGLSLALRARLGEARGSLCLSLAGEKNRHQAAVEGFREVLALGSGRQLNFQAELAEARGGLGLALLEPQATPLPESAYLDARSHYLRARSLTNDPAREKVFAAMVDLIDEALAEGGRGAADGSDAGASVSNTIWGRNDPPPPGVRRQLGYFYGIGDIICSPREPRGPKIDLSERPIVDEASTYFKPELGETLYVCAQGMLDSEPISLTVTGPDGVSRHRVLQPDPEIQSTQRYAVFWIDQRWPLGRYEAVAVQGDRSAKLVFTVHKPGSQGVRTPGGAPEQPIDKAPVMVVGAPPGANVTIDVYRVAPSGARTYATSFTIETNEDGYGERRLPIDPADDGSFSLRVRSSKDYRDAALSGGVAICDGRPCARDE